MTFHLTRATLDRPKQTIHACELVHAHAPQIARVCDEAERHTVVVAVVDAAEMLFAGIWTVPRAELARVVPDLECGGWAFTFEPRSTIEEIEDRALVTARLAFRRWEAMQRWAARHRGR